MYMPTTHSINISPKAHKIEDAIKDISKWEMVENAIYRTGAQSSIVAGQAILWMDYAVV
jgi:hypothetical protein